MTNPICVVLIRLRSPHRFKKWLLFDDSGRSQTAPAASNLLKIKTAANKKII